MALESDLPFKPMYVFIAPPSMDALEERLRGRGTETEAKIQLRLNNANSEMEAGKALPFDTYIVNDDVLRAKEALEAFLADELKNCSSKKSA
jgi:guanylate kinase